MLKICIPQACNFIKKETPAQVFSWKFCEILRTPIFIEHGGSFWSFLFSYGAFCWFSFFFKIAEITIWKNSSKKVLNKGCSFFHSRSYICYPETLRIWGIIHCAKSIRIRSYSSPHFSRISPHSERYGEIRSISPNAEKCGKNAN